MLGASKLVSAPDQLAAEDVDSVSPEGKPRGVTRPAGITRPAERTNEAGRFNKAGRRSKEAGRAYNPYREEGFYFHR